MRGRACGKNASGNRQTVYPGLSNGELDVSIAEIRLVSEHGHSFGIVSRAT
jgi:hypothetical protein